MQTAIEVQHVKKAFGQVAVLKDINLTVQQGEIFTLLGTNGAGKSTLINILATLSRQDAGTVTILGLDSERDGNQVRQRISLNAQTATVDAEFTGRENLRLIATLRGIKNVNAALVEVSDRLALGNFLDRKVKTYSGGMRRRLDLAMSLLGDAQIVFLDEPTTGVDPQNRLALWEMIREIRAAGKTVFLTTQYLDEADALSDHIAFIRDGVIVKQGTPAEIKQRTDDTYTIAVASGQGAKAAQILSAAGLTFTRGGDEGSERYSVAAKAVAPALQALLTHGIELEHVNRDEADLESVFLNLTKQEA